MFAVRAIDTRVIAELLSPRTGDSDRAQKFAHCKQLEARREHVLVWRPKPRARRSAVEDEPAPAKGA